MILYEQRHKFYAEARRRFEIDPHLHHHLELLYITQGELEVVINGTEYRATDGDVVFVFPNQIHAFRDLTPLRGYILLALPDDYPELAAIFNGNLPASPVIHTDNSEIAALFRSVSQHVKRKPAYKDEILRGYSLALFGLLLPLMELHPQNTSDLSVTQKVLLYCDEHYTEPLTLEHLARCFGVSRFYISHIFTDKIKINFNNYLHTLRIRSAKQLLQQESYSVTDVAYAVGYNNLRTFNRRFFAEEGCTPTEYRRTQTTTI